MKRTCRTEGPDGRRARARLDLDWKGITGWRQGERPALVDRGKSRDEIVEALLRIVGGQRLVAGSQRLAAGGADHVPVEGQLRMQVIEEEIAAAVRDLVGITGRVVIHIILMA